MDETSLKTQSNLDFETVANFGSEWSRFDQSAAPLRDLETNFAAYFSLFPKEFLHPHKTGLDLGCGSGRWARMIAPLVGRLICVDASRLALDVARRNLAACPNVEFIETSVSEVPLPASSIDFIFSLGVLHHVPDTAAAIRDCATLLKPGGPFLVYLYYNFENRPAWFRMLWRASDVARRVISRMPFAARRVASDLLAAVIYWPLARTARGGEAFGLSVENWPVSYYRDKGFYTMRTDALDRFGTVLEQRFSRTQIRAMMEQAGFENIRFSNEPPFWCAIGFKVQSGPTTSATL